MLEREEEAANSSLATREEVDEQNLKVQAFFAGKTEYEVQGKDDKAIKENNSNNEAEVMEPVLPLLDRHAQKAIRRRLVMEQIEKV